MKNAHWLIVRSKAEQPWRAVFVASNGRRVAVTENYTRRERALRAARLINPDVPMVDVDERDR